MVAFHDIVALSINMSRLSWQQTLAVGLLHRSALLHVRVKNLKSLKQYSRRNPKHPNKLKAEANTASQSCSHKLRNYYTRHKTKATNSINTDRQIRKLS